MPTPPRTMVALITPFAPDGTLDAAAHAGNLLILADRGLDGFLLGGSTGQGPYLEPGEREALTTVARTILGEGAFLLVGISAQSVRQAVPQVAEAADGGADAVLVTTPTLLLRSNHELVASFFRSVADASALPVFCYTVPAVTGYELPVDVAIDLARHPNIVGMKDSGGKPERIEPVVSGTDDDYVLYTGASRLVHEAVAAGAHGSITASANYAPHLAVASRSDAAAQRGLAAAAGSVERHGLAGTYAAAGLVGLTPGTMRAPLAPLAPDEIAALRSDCCPAAVG